MDNLINNGILPLTFNNAADYDNIDLLDELYIENAVEGVKAGVITVKNATKGTSYQMNLKVRDRQKEMLIRGGLLNLIKFQNS